MVTDTTDTHTDTHIHNLNTLLKKLDEMRYDGIPAPERLEFIQKHSKTFFVKEKVDWSRVYDDTAQPFFDHKRKLDELIKDWKVLQQSWTSISLPPDWKALGDELLKQLNGLFEEASRENSQREIEELSSIWETSPDISEYYEDCMLTAWGANEPYSRIRARESKKRRKEQEVLAEIKQVVEAAQKETVHPAHEDEEFQKVWRLWKDGNFPIHSIQNMDKMLIESAHQLLAKDLEETKEAVPEETSDIVPKETPVAPRISHTVVKDISAVEASSPRIDEHQESERKTYSVKNGNDENESSEAKSNLTESTPPLVTEGVVRSVRDPLGQPNKRPPSGVPEDMLLNAKTWTEALKAATCEVWNYAGSGASLSQGMGYVNRDCVSLAWRVGADGGDLGTFSETQLGARLDIVDERGGGHRVFMMLRSPKYSRRWHEETLSSEGLAKLHADPRAFVEKVLVRK